MFRRLPDSINKVHKSKQASWQTEMIRSEHRRAGKHVECT